MTAVSKLDFNVSFQHKYGYIRDERWTAMAQYGRGGKRWIWHDTTQNIAIRYDMIRSQNSLPYLSNVCCYLHCIHK